MHLVTDLADPLAVLVLVIDHGDKEYLADDGQLLRCTHVAIADVADADPDSVSDAVSIPTQVLEIGQDASLGRGSCRVHEHIESDVDAGFCCCQIADHEVGHSRLMPEVPTNGARVLIHPPVDLICGEIRPKAVGVVQRLVVGE